jgi:hypothetical protein
MIGMGVLAIVIAFIGPSMSTDGWQTRASATLQHWATLAAGTLSWLPGWALLLALVAGLVALVRRAASSRRRNAAHAAPTTDSELATDACCQASATTTARPVPTEEHGEPAADHPTTGIHHIAEAVHTPVDQVKETTR